MRRFIALLESFKDYHGPMVRVYHAQFHRWPDVLRNRNVKSYNSMGTWFCSNPNVATENYGDKVGVYEIPAEGYVEMDEENVNVSMGHCYPLIAQHLGKADEKQLQAVPWNAENRARWKSLRAKEAEYQQSTTGNGFQKYLTPAERRELNALAKSDEITRKALRHQGYCQDFRDMITHSGRHRGMVWRDVHWDGSTEASDIFLVFHKEDIHPVESYQSDREPGKHSGLLSLMRSVNSDE